MSDDRLRELERAWQASPNDQALLQALIAARRRAGLVVPGGLLEAQVFEARSFESKRRFDVFVCDVAGRVRQLGATSRVQPRVEVPAHRAWWVRPHAGSRSEALWSELREQGVPGLSLERLRPGGQEWRWLGRLESLRWLSLEDVRLTVRLMAEVAKLQALTHLNLRRSKPLSPLEGLTDEQAGSVAQLPTLTHLDLAGSEQLTQAGLAEVATGASPLSSLDLSYSAELDNDALQALSGTPELSRLLLRANPALTHYGLSKLSKLPGLAELDLIGVAPLDRGAVRGLEELPLVRLALGDVSEHEHPAALLQRIPSQHLSHLRIHSARGPLTLNLSELEPLLRLEELDLTGVGLGKSWFSRQPPVLARLRELSVSELVSLNLGELAAACPVLERLRIAGGACWEEELEALATLPLRELSVELVGPDQARGRSTPLPDLPPRSDAERAAIRERLQALAPFQGSWAFPAATCFGGANGRGRAG